MDKKFNDFEKWVNSQISNWKEHGVIVDRIREATHAHQFHNEGNYIIGESCTLRP